jgi:Protein of unknown function (DUF1348)
MTDTATTTLTWDAAKRLVQDVEDAFGAADLARIEQGFTEDVVTRFADFPELRGREAVMRFLRARFARTKGYRLTKTLHCVMAMCSPTPGMPAGRMDRPARRCWVAARRSGACATAASRCGMQRSTSGKRAVRQARRWFSARSPLTVARRPPRCRHAGEGQHPRLSLLRTAKTWMAGLRPP